MIAAGVALGLAAALCQSASYFFSRLFVLRKGGGGLRLLVLGHLLMGLMSLAILAAWRPAIPRTGAFVAPLLSTALFYLSGQACLFYALRHVEASRASPLLGLKILVLAAITVLAFRQRLTGLQWLAAGLAVAAAFLLNRLGRTLPGRALAGILLACVTYSLSDLSIVRLVPAVAEGHGAFAATLLAVTLSYVICGLVALILWPWAGRATADEWRYAMPFAVSWLAAMLFLFACFAQIGAVMGNVVQSTRGLMTVAIGAVLAHYGIGRGAAGASAADGSAAPPAPAEVEALAAIALEPKVDRRLLARRLAAAALMSAAVALFFLG